MKNLIITICLFVSISFNFVNAQTIDTTNITRDEVLDLNKEELIAQPLDVLVKLIGIVGVASLDELFEFSISSAGKQKEQVKEIPSSIVIITRKEIENYGFRDIEEILENVQGLFINRGLLTTNFGVRGSYGTNNIVYLINGINQYGRFIVPIEAIDRVEVVRGPMSVIYGTGAFFGVINIITNEEIDGQNNNIIGASYGSNETYRLAGKFNYKKNDDFKTSVSVGGFGSDGRDIPYKDMIINPDRLTWLGVPKNKTTKGQLESEKKSMNISTEFKNFYFDLTYTKDYSEKIYFYPVVSEGSLTKRTNNFLTVGYKKDILSNLSIDAKINYFKENKTVDFDFDLSLDHTNTTNLEHYYFNEEIKSERIVGEINLFYNPYDFFDITLGLYTRSETEAVDFVDINFWELNNHEVFYVDDQDQAVTNAVFTQFNYKPLSNLKLVAGLRVEKMLSYNMYKHTLQGTENETIIKHKYDGSNLQVVPRFAFIYSINDKNILKLLYGQSIRNPSIETIYKDFSSISKGLKEKVVTPEKIETIEINYTISFDNKLIPSISLFRNKFEDMLIDKQVFLDNGSYGWVFSNTGRMITNGLEVSVLSKLSKNLSLNISGIFQKTEDQKNKNITVGNSPEILAYMKLAYSKKRFTFGLTANYVDKMQSAYSTKNGRDANFVGDYLNVGLNFRVNNLFKKSYFTSLRISNLLNEEIRYTSVNQEFSKRGYIGEKISFLVTFGKKF